MARYTVSKDRKSGLWYAHKEGYSYIPVAGSFCEKKSDAMEYVKMNDPRYMGKFNSKRIEEIEAKRRAEFEKELEEGRELLRLDEKRKKMASLAAE
jgi:hypothetical protein